MYVTLFILLIVSFFFIQGKVRSDLVAMCALLALALFGILEPAEALAGFSNSVVIMMIGLFIVGAGIFRTGLAKMLSSKILLLAGKNENLLFFLVMLVTASVGAFISNTGTVAVMLPIVMSMATDANISSRRYLMPMAFASSMGLFTLISTPPNLVIQENLVKGGYEALSFFSFAPVGFVALSVGIVVLFFLSKLLVSKKDGGERKDKKGRTLRELAESYNLHEQLHIVSVSAASPLVGKTLAELSLPSRYEVGIVKLVHVDRSFKLKKNVIKEQAGPDSVILADDVLYCNGSAENIERFAAENQLQVDQANEKELKSLFRNYGIAEVFIMPKSRLINLTILEIGFREKYNLTVVGIERNGEYLLEDIKNTKLHAGDALLVQGTWTEIANLADNQEDIILAGQPLKEASKVTLDHKAPIAAGIMLCMIVVMVLDIIPAVIAVLIAATLMVILGCLRNMEEAYNSINWESVVLIAAMMPMATAFEKTGVTNLISGGLMTTFGDMGPYVLLAGIYFCTSLLTMFISNTATAVLLAPIAMQTALSMDYSPYPFLFAVAVAASMCFASPFSTPPNALVMGAGGYTFTDYIKVGLPLQIIMGIVMVFILPMLFGF
ncbi:MAG: SLC13 family permease [Tannerellaceae bacterium]|nr:SLC13 family permease [Tannerellaceae bacterium]